MTHCDDIGYLLNLLPEKTAASGAIAVSKAWTYAPGQSFFAHHLFGKPKTWQDALFAARLPSAIAGSFGVVLALLLVLVVHWEYGASAYTGLLAAAFAAGSIRALVESQQGYPYATSYPVAAVLALWLVYSLQTVTLRSTLIAWGGVAFLGGAGVLFNYQILLLAAAAAGAVLLIGAREAKRDYAAFRAGGLGLPLCIAISGTAVGAALFFKIWTGFLAERVKLEQGVPNWAKFDVAAWSYTGIVKKLAVFFGYSVVPVWPDLVGQEVVVWFGYVVLALAAAGFICGVRHKSGSVRGLAWFSAAAILGTLLASLMGKVPFGVTRHSHFLLVPVISLILLAELGLGRWEGKFRYAAIIVFVLFWSRYDDFSRLTRNQFDMEKLSEAAAKTNALWVVGTSCTEDPRVSQAVFERKLLGCGVTVNLSQAVQALAEREGEGTVLLADHRGDPLPFLQQTLKDHPDWKTDLLTATAPTGSTELSGIVNGGNGFYIRRLTKQAPIPQSCEVRFGEGWYTHERLNASTWWRWASDRAQLWVVTPHPVNLRIEGGLNTLTAPNAVTVRIPGQPDRQFGAPGGFSFEIQASAGRTMVEMVSKAPARQPYPDPRSIGFGAVNVKVTKLGASPGCQIQGK